MDAENYMQGILCPICGREYKEKREECECGFVGLKQAYDADELYFKIYKFAKRVFRGMIEYPADKITESCIRWVFEDDFNQSGKRWQELQVDRLEGNRGLAVLEADTDLPVCTLDGLFAFQYGVKAAIINAEYIDTELTGESAVRILFLGTKFKKFRRGNLDQCSPLKYIEVHGDNENYSSRGNVLFDKRFKRLCLYPSARKDEEYTVPASVQVISENAFFRPRHLKKLRLPEGVKLEGCALYGCGNLEIEYYKK